MSYPKYDDPAHAAIERAKAMGIPWWTLPSIPAAVLVRASDVAACPFLSAMAGDDGRDCWCSHAVLGARTLAIIGRALAFLGQP